jgi:hypothetical protein
MTLSVAANESCTITVRVAGSEPADEVGTCVAGSAVADAEVGAAVGVEAVPQALKLKTTTTNKIKPVRTDFILQLLIKN